jgi:hypothetical protein
MRHPELMLSADGARIGVEFLHMKMEELKKERPSLPVSTFLASAAVDMPGQVEERATLRELPYILGLVQKQPVYWKLDAGLAQAMVATDPPEDPQLEGFRLPHQAIWVEVPPIFEVWNNETGMHRVEGFYLAEDWMPSRKAIYRRISNKEKQLFELNHEERELLSEEFRAAMDENREDTIFERAILVLVVGESRSKPVKGKIVIGEGNSFDVVSRDDALLSFWIFTEDHKRRMAEDPPGSAAARRTVTNLLMAIQSDYVTHERVLPKSPKSPKKIARATRRGESFSPYTVIHLGKRYAGEKSAGGERPTTGEKSQKARIIRGHWNHYWVLRANVGNRVVLETQAREGKEELCKIRLWLRPQVIGNPDPKMYLVKG